MDWSNLPPEILSLIFRFGSVRSVLQHSLVCSNWRGSTCDPGLWKVLYFSTTQSPAYTPDAKLDWRQLVLRKYIVKRNLKESQCLVRSVSSDVVAKPAARSLYSDFSSTDTTCLSLVGDWCSILEKHDTYLINVVTEKKLLYKNKFVYLTSGGMMFTPSTIHHLMRDVRFGVFSESTAPEAQIFHDHKTRNFVYIVKNGDSNSPFVGICFQRGQDDWYHNTGGTYGIYDLRTMELLMEIHEHRKIRRIALCKHYLFYYDPCYPSKTKCVNLLTKEETNLAENIHINNIFAGANKVALFVYDDKTIIYDVNTKKTSKVKFPLSYTDTTAIYHDTMLVCSKESAIFFFDIHTGKLINGINTYHNISEFSELSNGDLAIRTSTQLRVVSFQQQQLNKRIRIQGIYQLENKCHIQEETVSTCNLMEFISSKVGGFENIDSYLFNASPTERYGIIFYTKILGSPTKQKQLRNNYATRLLKKASTAQGYQPYSFTRSLDQSYYGGYRNRTKPSFIDGHAFLYFERLIDGRWQLSSPSPGNPWPEK